jgi:hypothetical protein
MMDHVFSFLDIRTLESCRQVNQKWDGQALSQMMNRNVLVVAKVPVRERNCSSRFTSWVIYYQEDEKFMTRALRQHGSQLQYLSIKKFPISQVSMSWLSDVVALACPNLLELCIVPLQKRDKRCCEVDNAVKLFAAAYDGEPSKDARGILHKFGNLHTLRLNGLWTTDSEPFVHLLLTACPSLKHVYLHCFGTRLLRWLAVHTPDVTMQLETFVWMVPDVDDDNGHTAAAYTAVELDLARNLRSIYDNPHLQFSEKLKHLHLDTLHFGDTSEMKLIPAWLSGPVAGSIRKLGTRMAVVDLRNRSDAMRWTKVAAPVLQNLTVLEIGIRTCYTISLSDVVDGLPNLKKLTITARQPLAESRNETECIPANEIWRNVSAKDMTPHNSVVHFTTQVGLRNAEVLKQVLFKFPKLQTMEMLGFYNQEEVRIGELFDVLEEFGKDLRWLRWTKGESVPAITLKTLIEHTMQVQKLHHLRMYELSCTLWNGILPKKQDMRKFAAEKRDLFKLLLELKGSPSQVRVYLPKPFSPNQFPFNYLEPQLTQYTGMMIHEIQDFAIQNDIPIRFPE